MFKPARYSEGTSSDADSDEQDAVDVESPPAKLFRPSESPPTQGNNNQVTSNDDESDDDDDDEDEESEEEMERPSFGGTFAGNPVSSKSTDNVESSPSTGVSAVSSLTNVFIKKDSSSSGGTAVYNDVAKKLMAKMGFQEGQGLGRKGQGIKAPVEASKHKGRRGLGMLARGFEPANVVWDFDKEHVSADETVDWLPENKLPVPPLDELQTWLKEGPKKLTIDDEADFCSVEILQGVLSSKSIFDNLEEEEMRKARTRSNPYETIRGVFFLNRAAMKMANIDAILDFMFTNPRDRNEKPLVGPNELLYFADICAGPGGFSEYVLWRKKWDAKGFGFTLKGPNDFKLEDFFAAPCELFEPHYGVNGADGDGDIYNPENLREFQRFVLENTDQQGVHFVMADGGFSVDGQENIQEILSKRLYLCQFLCALMILRPGGSFVCKLFDLFTLFSVGLVYLMYRAFDHVALFKPVTSRPANSERYIVCQGKRADSEPIQQYMFGINERMCHIWPGSRLSELDISEVVPLEIVHDDEAFYQYVYDSNVKMAEQQIISLVKIQSFAQNTDLRELRQAEIRRLCLEKWQIPDEVRTAPDKTEKPHGKFASLTKDSMSEYQAEPSLLSSTSLHEKIKSIFDYRCIVTGAEQRLLVISLGRSHVFRWDGKPGGKWQKVEEVKLELPKDTILEVEFVQELRGEGKGQRRVTSVHIVDALFLFGTDVRQLHYNERMEKAKKFVKAISRPTRSDLAPIRVKELVRFEQVENVFQSLQMKVIKGSGHTRKVCYCCHSQGDQSRYIVPTGVLFIRIVNDPWMMALSKSQRRKYYYNTIKHTAVFETPKDSIASYLSCLKNRLFWPWDDTVHLCDDQPVPRNTRSPDSLSKEAVIEFVHEKLH